jgi:PAS domain S-box-containing protein
MHCQARLTRLMLNMALMCTLVAALPAVAVAQSLEDAGESPKQVLYINSYHQGYDWSDSISREILRTFNQQEPEAKVFTEYLDTKHFAWNDARKAAALKNLMEKYGPEFFQLAIASDDAAFEFMKEFRDILMPGKPVIFCGVNSLDPRNDKLPDGFTGVVEVFDYAGIIGMAQALFPERANIAIIADNSVTGISIIKAAQKELQKFPQITYEFLDGKDLTHADLLARLRNIDDKTFVIIGVWQTDKNNTYFTVPEAFADIAKASSAPVFVALKSDLAYGFAGGSVVSGSSQGRRAATIALDILAGKPVSEIPIDTNTVSNNIVNRKLLEERWKINWESLPEFIKSMPDDFAEEGSDNVPAPLQLTTAEKQWIRDNPTITVGTGDLPPLLMLTDPPGGFSIDLMKELAALTGLEVKFETWTGKTSDFVKNAEQGNINWVIAALTDTPERRNVLAFTRPYVELEWVIFTRDDSPFVSGMGDLAGKTVAVHDGLTVNDIIARKYPKIILKPMEISREGMIALNSHQVDALIMHLSTGVWLTKEMGLTRIRVAAPTNLPPHKISIAVPVKQKVLADILDKAIASLPAGKVDTLKHRYMTQIVINQGWATESVLKILLVFAAVFLLVLSILIYRLRRGKTILRQREQNLQITLDSIGDAVIVTDASGRVVRMNPVAQRLTGWTIEQATDHLIDDVMILVNPDSEEKLPGATDKSTGNKPVREPQGHVELVSKDLKHYLVEYSAAPITSEGAQPSGTIVVFKDVTEKLRFEEQMQHSRKMEAIGQLAGGVAHDFNNMLSAIQGYAELLTRKVPENSVENVYCQRIFNATERAAGLTSKLLDFARKGKTLSTPIDIHESIKNAIGLLERSLDKSIVIKSNMAAANSLIVGDPSQIQSVILNLCINARDAMPDGGVLEISTGNVYLTEKECASSEFQITPGDYVAVHVTDSGSGISKANIRKIFEPFFTTKGIGKGTGLGLAAVHGAIVEHAGAISVYSEEGRGTQFNIYLPVSSEMIVTTKGEYSSDIKREGLVLVVEDEPIIRSMAEVMLKDLGFEVISADNGTTGVEMFRQYADRLKLVLLDVIMPEMDGMTALKLMKDIRQDVPFIISSGFSFDHRREEFFQMGANTFLSKPFRGSALVKAVDECLGR